MLALFGSFGGQEILVILVLVLLLFGARRLPELARSLGQGIKEFRKSVKEISEDTESDDSGSSTKSS
ncbi:MAG: twin-arginine translocase TatA/TatE family subunit [Armatimonadota bacterium]|jgi:sec-independent protein translocase protein TatA|nr:MAG: twin-arginine translocase TatA/TatE family subunit [Armatimonadota bacterium]